MALVQNFMNTAVSAIGVTALVFFLPYYLFFKLVFYAFRSMFSEHVAGKVVLITGASSGIGEHLAYEYARRGACLALVARRENSLREVANAAYHLGSPEVILIRADVSKVEDCERFINATVDHFGRLDHLVNNAGISPVSLFEESTVYDSAPIMASKAAILSFYETLRTEVGTTIGITIVTPGLIESELTMGKFLSKEGTMIVDQEMRDVKMSLTPVESVTRCAKMIVDSDCRGDNYLTVPAWMRVTYFWKVFFPEILQWCSHWLLLPRPGASETDTISKKLIDLPLVKRFVYSASIRFPEINDL